MLENETGRKSVVQKFESCGVVLVKSHIRREEVVVVMLKAMQKGTLDG